ncbi:MAG: hypothetical protein ACD_22C00062G0005 [uncultured bacterium]|nr:MAG: hypothetical protein ACD_22C00062G0005 [uncultured bacterium]
MKLNRGHKLQVIVILIVMVLGGKVLYDFRTGGGMLMASEFCLPFRGLTIGFFSEIEKNGVFLLEETRNGVLVSLTPAAQALVSALEKVVEGILSLLGGGIVVKKIIRKKHKGDNIV